MGTVWGMTSQFICIHADLWRSLKHFVLIIPRILIELLTKALHWFSKLGSRLIITPKTSLSSATGCILSISLSKK